MVTRPDQRPRRGDLTASEPVLGLPPGPSAGPPGAADSHGTAGTAYGMQPAAADPGRARPVGREADFGAAGNGPLRRRRRLLGDAKIRTKVILVLLLPVLVIVSLAGVAVAGSVQSATSATSVERLARF